MRSHDLFAALGDPTRLTLIDRLASDGPATATQLSVSLPISRQAVVKHLAALESAGLVAKERLGRAVNYTFDPGPLAEVVGWVGAVGAAWDTRLERLRSEVERAGGG